MPNNKFKTRFPPARIKKIMQTDEEVGKVAAAVPVIVSKSVELFTEILLQKSGEIALSRGARTLSIDHIRQCVEEQNKFDFLRDIVQEAAAKAVGKPADDRPPVGDSSSAEPPNLLVSPSSASGETSRKMFGASSKSSGRKKGRRKLLVADDIDESVDVLSLAKKPGFWKTPLKRTHSDLQAPAPLASPLDVPFKFDPDEYSPAPAQSRAVTRPTKQERAVQHCFLSENGPLLSGSRKFHPDSPHQNSSSPSAPSTVFPHNPFNFEMGNSAPSPFSASSNAQSAPAEDSRFAFMSPGPSASRYPDSSSLDDSRRTPHVYNSPTAFSSSSPLPFVPSANMSLDVRRQQPNNYCISTANHFDYFLRAPKDGHH